MSWSAGRTFRRRYLPERSSPANVLMSINTILHERQLEEYYCALCYALFDLKRRTVTLANSGVPYPIRVERRCRAARSSCRACRSGRSSASSYDEVTFPLVADDLFVFCSDGVSEAMNAAGEEFTTERLMEVVEASRRISPPAEVVAASRSAVDEHRAGFPPNDDSTIVVLRITET